MTSIIKKVDLTTNITPPTIISDTSPNILTNPLTSTTVTESFIKFKNSAVDLIPNIIMSIIILIIFFTIANLIRDLINGKGLLLKYFNLQPTVISEYTESRNRKIFFYELGEIAYYLIVCFGIIFAITNLGIQTPAILTLLGTLVVGISLSMQGTIGNIWAGLYISLANLYNIGDRIAIGVVSGKVTEFTLFNTVIFDEKSNAEITIPNTTIQNGLLTNFSKFPTTN
jgi:small conductance mechanosensitive channel